MSVPLTVLDTFLVQETLLKRHQLGVDRLHALRSLEELLDGV